MNNLYLAGLFDGEGHISIYKKNRCETDSNWTREYHYYPVVKLGMTDGWETIKELQKIYGGNLYVRKYHPNHKDLLAWTLRGKERIIKFLDDISPALIIKKKQAEIVYEFYNGYGKDGIPIDEEEWKRRENLFTAIKKLNFRGKSLAETE